MIKKKYNLFKKLFKYYSRFIKKNKSPGFTLVEVMVSLAIMALVLISLLGLEISLTRSTYRATEKLSRIWIMKNYLYDSSLNEPEKKKKQIKKEIDRPKMSLEYQRGISIAKGSVLAEFDNLFINQVKATWVDSRKRQQTDSLVSLKYVAPEEKEKKDKEKEKGKSEKIS